MLKHKLLLLLIICPSLSFAQTTLIGPANIEAAYNKGTRAFNGNPGPIYWQNTANYLIKVNFDPIKRDLTGTVDIDYTNNSPDTLKQIWFKLYPNFFAKGSLRNFKVEPADLSDGVQIKSMSINNSDQDVSTLVADGTNLTVNIPPLLSKQKIHFTISYAYNVNKTSHVRTGQVDEGTFFIAYFYPRIAVYDDIDGWNKYPYLGNEEFYNDFCHFKTEITLPGNYAVWATGTLKNPEEVYQPAIIKRIRTAEKVDTVIDVITPDDISAGNITQKNAFNTWKFEADNVTDMAFALSDHYLWKATSLVVDSGTGRRTRTDAVFNPVHKDYFDVIGYARKTVESMSFKFPKWPFPYPHETVFDGLDQMEYPMMANDNPLDKISDEIELTTHEIFHTMFPFYMGVNETKYGWMDEGWATAGEWVITPVINPSITDIDGIAAYEADGGKEDDVPIATLTPQLTGVSFLSNSYPKPALGYLYVKDMLGDALFTKALHYYISQWHGKHPMPYDFFNCMNTGSGMNLNWFWKNWFLDRGTPDQAITKVTVKNKNEYMVIVTNIGTKMIPVDITVHYINGTTKKIHRDVSCWRNGNKAIAVNFVADKTVLKIELGGPYDPDVNKANNIYVVTK